MKLLMRDEAKGREHTIFVTIFSALMVMLAIVVMLMASATAVSGVTLQLDKNAVDILDKQVENRAGYIQDQLQQAQDLTGLSSFINDTARKMLDEAGWTECQISVSNSLDEYIVRDLILQGARVDSFGIGENMITAKSDPVFGGVYKLAAVREDDGSYTPKMKLSESAEKMTIPCLKKVWRIYDQDGKAMADLITMADEVVETQHGITLFDPIETWKECTYVNSTARCISTPIYENGKRVYTNPNLADIRKFCKAQVGTLWDEVKRFENPHRYYVDLSRNLWDTRSELLKKLSK